MISQNQQASLFAVSFDPEWQFENCPQKQLHWCDIYEHARENKLVLAMVARYRRTKEWTTTGHFPDQSSSVLGKAFVDAFPEFPEVPFLSLNAAVRVERCRLLDRLRSKLKVALYEGNGARSLPEETVLLRIHRRASRAEVLRALAELTQVGPEPQRPKKYLQHLSLARLYRRLDTWPAVHLHLDKVQHELSEKNPSQCSKANKKAGSNIKSVLSRIL